MGPLAPVRTVSGLCHLPDSPGSPTWGHVGLFLPLSPHSLFPLRTVGPRGTSFLLGCVTWRKGQRVKLSHCRTQELSSPAPQPGPRGCPKATKWPGYRPLGLVPRMENQPASQQGSCLPAWSLCSPSCCLCPARAFVPLVLGDSSPSGRPGEARQRCTAAELMASTVPML